METVRIKKVRVTRIGIVVGGVLFACFAVFIVAGSLVWALAARGDAVVSVERLVGELLAEPSWQINGWLLFGALWAVAAVGALLLGVLAAIAAGFYNAISAAGAPIELEIKDRWN